MQIQASEPFDVIAPDVAVDGLVAIESCRLRRRPASGLLEGSTVA